MKTVTISNLSRPEIQPILAGYCSSFACQLRGLMFYDRIPVGQGLLLAYAKDDRLNSTIHMMNMRFDLCVVWIDLADQVVDVRLAQRGWHVYTPRTAASKVLEMETAHMEDFKIGEKVHIDDAQPA